MLYVGYIYKNRALVSEKNICHAVIVIVGTCLETVNMQYKIIDK